MGQVCPYWHRRCSSVPGAVRRTALVLVHTYLLECPSNDGIRESGELLNQLRDLLGLVKGPSTPQAKWDVMDQELDTLKTMIFSCVLEPRDSGALYNPPAGEIIKSGYNDAWLQSKIESLRNNLVYTTTTQFVQEKSHKDRHAEKLDAG